MDLMGPHRVAVIVTIAAILVYSVADILLLGPFIVHNVPLVDPNIVVGYVNDTSSSDFRTLPEPVRLSVEHQNYSSIFLMKHLSPEENYAVLVGRNYSRDNFVVVKSYAQWYVDYRDMNYPKWSFVRLIVANVIQSSPRPDDQSSQMLVTQAFVTPLQYGASTENSLRTTSGQYMLLVSTAAFYLGPLVIVFIAYLESRRIRVWSIAAVGWLYTLHVFLLTTLAGSYKAQVPLTLNLLGYSTFGFAVLAIALYRYEVLKQHDILSTILRTK